MVVKCSFGRFRGQGGQGGERREYGARLGENQEGFGHGEGQVGVEEGLRHGWIGRESGCEEGWADDWWVGRKEGRLMRSRSKQRRPPEGQTEEEEEDRTQGISFSRPATHKPANLIYDGTRTEQPELLCTGVSHLGHR